MKFQSYVSTPGLDRFPREKRYAIYRATHKRLMREDTAYRRRFNSYLCSVVMASAAAGVAGSGMPGVILSIVMATISAIAVIFMAFRQQGFMNERIGDVLHRRPSIA